MMERASAPLTVMVIAAGRGRRFGKTSKLEADLAGQSVLARALAAYADVDFVSRLLVVREPSGKSATIGRDLGWQVIVNGQADDGMGTSLACGVRHLLSQDAVSQPDALLVGLGDMPLIRPETITGLVRAYGENQGVSIMAPLHGGRRGHPVLFARSHFAELARCQGDQGARSVIETSSTDIHRWCCDDPGICVDVDTKDDLERARAMLVNRPA